jgi:hypothetical protein
VIESTSEEIAEKPANSAIGKPMEMMSGRPGLRISAHRRVDDLGDHLGVDHGAGQPHDVVLDGDDAVLSHPGRDVAHATQQPGSSAGSDSLC